MRRLAPTLFASLASGVLPLSPMLVRAVADGGQVAHLPEIKAVSSTNLTPIPVSVTFSKYGLDADVTGFTGSDLNVTGAAVANFKAISSSSYTFDLVPNLVMWMGGSDLDGDWLSDSGESGEAVLKWRDKSDNGYDFTGRRGDPTRAAGPNGNGVVDFDGDDGLWAGKSLYGKVSRFTIFSVARWTGGDNQRVISSRDSWNWFFGFHDGHKKRIP